MNHTHTHTRDHADTLRPVDARYIAAYLAGYDAGEQTGASPAAPAGRALWLQGYDAGRADGIAAGRRQVEAELAARWNSYRAELLARAGQPSYAVLCDRRGHRAEQAGHHDTAARERARAARQRELEASIAAMPGPFEDLEPLPVQPLTDIAAPVRLASRRTAA